MTSDILPYPPLPAEFYRRDTVDIAKNLVGKILAHYTPSGLISGRIAETEAYLQNDPACHASRGISKRNQVMFGEHGHAYVYLIYGIYCCLNAVTLPVGIGEAVLIRAIEPISGIDLMIANRCVEKRTDLCNGPGKLCKAFGIDLSHNGSNLVTGSLKILDDGYHPVEIVSAPRIGISRAIDAQLRFYEKNNNYISAK